MTDIPERGGHGRHHVPVLLKEAIEFLAIKRGGTYIDATVGLGGHSLEIAKRLGGQGHLIGVDKDPAALAIARRKIVVGPSSLVVGEKQDQQRDWPTVELIHGSFADVADEQKAGSIDGILADIGVSSLQLNDPARGFSFQAEGPLDMRMNHAGRAIRRSSGK